MSEEHKLKTYAPYAFKGHCPTGSTIDACELCGICRGLMGLVVTREVKDRSCEDQQAINATHDWVKTKKHPFTDFRDWYCQRCGAISAHDMITPYCDMTCAEYAMKKVVG